MSTRYKMKTRVISALIALIIAIPIFLKGGFIFNVFIYILSILGLKEFLDIKDSKKELPSFITFISFIFMSLIVLYNTSNSVSEFSMDYRVIASLFLVFLLPTVLYHDRKKYSINDAFYLIGGIFFLGVSFSLIIILRSIDMNLLLYLFLITIMTDTYAYLIGRLIGKNKLLVQISPNKSWEGMIAGTVIGTFIAAEFYKVVVNPSTPMIQIVFVTLFLSILGQFGDLVFSAIKRYYNKKDFSNIMPGHGGILDRLDSIIFVVLGILFLIEFI